MSGNLLSDAALHQVRELIRQESGRARGERTWYEPPLTKGPECFMAYASSGIDALSGTTPGYADCELYELASDGTLSALMLDGSTNNQRTVYNASATAVSSGVYTPVWKDKLGTWWVAPWGGSTIAAFSGNQPGIPRPTFDNTPGGTLWPVVNVVVRGSSLVTADTTNNWWNLAASGTWLVWGSVTVSVNTADTQTQHNISYSENDFSTSTQLDAGWRMHPVAGTSGTKNDTVFFSGAASMAANSKIRIKSFANDSGVTGYMYESNLNFLLV